MLTVIATLVIAGVLGLLLGGRPSRLAELRIRLIPSAILALAFQIAPIGGTWWPRALLYVSFVLLGTFAAANVLSHVPGARPILFGVLLNLLVIGVNGGMPVSAEALARFGQDALGVVTGEGGAKHHLAGPDDRLVVLADVIVLRPIGEIVSVGDLLIFGGVAWLVVAGMRMPAPPAPTRAARRLGTATFAEADRVA